MAGLELRASAVDRAVAAAFEDAQPGVTVVAVGGFGRRALFPHSDVDLLLLVDGPPEPAARERIAAFVRSLWDGGLRVGQSVHTVAECCQLHDGNLELTIALLDARYLAGEPGRYRELERLFPRFLHAHADVVARRLCQATRARHACYADTIYHLEPNVKEHPGGLRDLHVIGWLGKLRNLAPEPLDGALDFLSGVRVFLHRRSGRDDNLLSFDAQDAIAPDPAGWMRGYYLHARAGYRAARGALELPEAAGSALLAQFRDWRGRLSTPEFTVSRERVFLRAPGHLAADSGLPLRLAQFLSRHRLRLAPDTERRLRELARGPAPGLAWPEFRRLLELPDCAAGLRALHDAGFLQAALPEWSRIDCLVVRDFYHRYTVDEHTLVAIERLEALAPGQLAPDARFAGVLTEVDRPDLLRLALLLHDLGKGAGTGEHAAASAAIARNVVERLGVPDPDAATVLFLVEHHLDLSAVMNARDLSDPATAAHIAARCGTLERLKLLALMTYCDICAVHPAAMTAWRAERLWLTYLAGHEELTRALDAQRIRAVPLDRVVARFVEGFPTRYLRTHSPAEIRRHAAMLNQADLERRDGVWRLTVVTRDRPHLLAAVSGALSSFGMNILKAEAYSNAAGIALETLTFADPHRTLELNPPEAGRLRETVLGAAAGSVSVPDLLKRRPARAVPRARVQPAVAFHSDASETATLIEIVAADRPGLLYDLTRAIAAAGCNIEVVLIDTEAHKALDVFYVTSAGRKLTGAEEASLRRALLAAT